MKQFVLSILMLLSYEALAQEPTQMAILQDGDVVDRFSLDCIDSVVFTGDDGETVLDRLKSKLDALSSQIDSVRRSIEAINSNVCNINTDTSKISTGNFIEGVYLYKNGQPDGRSANMLCSDFIEVQPERMVCISNLYISDYTFVHFYDSHKVWVGRLESEKQSTQHSRIEFKVPLNCKYIRYTIYKTQTESNTVEYTDTVANNALEMSLINGWFNDSYQKMGKLFSNASNMPIITIIDDDTPTSEGVLRVKSLCDSAGIKCTFAVLTKQFEWHPDLIETLKGLEREGFHMALHGYTQGEFYRNPETYMKECEDDLVHGLQDMRCNGFADPCYWITPFGVQKQELKDLAKKWSFNALVTITHGIEDTRASNGKWALRRCGLNESDEGSSCTMDQLLDYIDDCAANNKWLLIGTHIAGGWKSDDYSRFLQIVEYAKKAGCRFMTLGEAWNYRKSIYDFYEMY